MDKKDILIKFASDHGITGRIFKSKTPDNLSLTNVGYDFLKGHAKHSYSCKITGISTLDLMRVSKYISTPYFISDKQSDRHLHHFDKDFQSLFGLFDFNLHHFMESMGK